MNQTFYKTAYSRTWVYQFSMSSRAILLALAMLAAPPVQAAAQSCGGTLSNLYIDDVGTVFATVSWRSDYVAFCNVNQSIGPVTQTTCMAWLSMMRSAVQRGAQTLTYYAEAPSCNAMPIYRSAPVPGYFMLQN